MRLLMERHRVYAGAAPWQCVHEMFLVASLLLLVRPGAPGSVLVPSSADPTSVLAPSSMARSPK